jgi:hypothetical protein
VRFYRDKAGLPEAELRTPIDAIDAAKITPSHAVVEFADIYTNAIKPEQDKVFTNEQPMKVAFETMAPLAEEVMRRTAPR